jgi:hypothetical protein
MPVLFPMRHEMSNLFRELLFNYFSSKVKPLFILRETGFKNQYSVVKRDYKIFVETIFIEVVYREKRNTNEPLIFINCTY